MKLLPLDQGPAVAATKATKKTSRSLTVVVLAAGKGKRLKSKSLPKVLHPVCGRPALWHILSAAKAVRPDRVVIVVHHGAEQVERAVREWGIRPTPVFVDQGEPLGTGHAVLTAKKAIGDATDVLVLAGDDPLIEGSHLRRIMTTHRRTKSAATILTSVIEDPTGYGRVVRRGNRLVQIAEESDATAEVRDVHEIATLFYAFGREHLFRALPKVGRENRQREYYLPDALTILVDTGERVSVVQDDSYVHVGLNSRGGLAEINRRMRARINAGHLAGGVSILDPATAFIDIGSRIGPDTVVHPLTFIEGDTRIGEGCEIGPSAQLRDARVGNGTMVRFSIVEEARIGADAVVGPFARVRPGTVLRDGVYAGSYVEIKGSTVGRGSKVPHLSYVGDAKIGANVNIGAATVTVNYDGYEKHTTVVEDDARVGSDTMLVAPVRIGKGAATGAGSVITKDVPAGALGLERSEQKNVRGYRARKDAKHAGAADGSPTSKNKKPKRKR